MPSLILDPDHQTTTENYQPKNSNPNDSMGYLGSNSPSHERTMKENYMTTGKEADHDH